MNDTIEAPPASTTQAHDPGSTFSMFVKPVPADKPEPEDPTKQFTLPPAEGSTEPVKPNEKPPVEKPNAGEDSLPAEFVTGAKPEEKKPSEYDTLIAEPPKGQVNHERFVKLQEASKARVAEVQTKLEAATAELEKLRTSGVPEEIQTELKTLRERSAQLEEELEREAFSRSPKFKREFLDKEAQLQESVREVGKEYDLDNDTVDGLLAVKGRRRDEMIDGLDIASVAKTRLTAELLALDKLGKDRDATLKQSKEQLKAHRDEQDRLLHERAQVESAENDRIFTERLDAAKGKLPGFRKIDGNEGWNAEVEQRLAYAKDYFSGKVMPHEVADVILAGMNAPVYERIIDRLKTELKAAQEREGKLKGAAPTGGDAPSVTPREGQNGNHDPGHTFHHFMAQAQNGQR